MGPLRMGRPLRPPVAIAQLARNKPIIRNVNILYERHIMSLLSAAEWDREFHRLLVGKLGKFKGRNAHDTDWVFHIPRSHVALI